MADIVSNESKMNDVEINTDVGITTAMLNKVGANINSAIDKITTNIANIATNIANIATNTANILALQNPTINIVKSALFTGAISSSTGPSVTITGVTSGVVMVSIESASGGASTTIGPGGSSFTTLTIKRGATAISRVSGGSVLSHLPPGAYIDDASGTGSITYNLHGDATVSDIKLVAYELKD